MSRKYRFHNPEGVYFVSFAVQLLIRNWITSIRTRLKKGWSLRQRTTLIILEIRECLIYKAGSQTRASEGVWILVPGCT